MNLKMGIWDDKNFACFAHNQSSHTIFPPPPKQKILDKTLTGLRTYVVAITQCHTYAIMYLGDSSLPD